MDVPNMSQFKWNAKKSQAAVLLAEGYTINETADTVGVSEKTVDRWLGDIDFSLEVDKLSLMVGVASRAERLRIAKKMIRGLAKKQVPTHKDLLEWLKYAQGETDGIKLDLTPLYDAIAPMAGGGQSGADEENSSDTAVEPGQ